jgi:hypothetical protein
MAGSTKTTEPPVIIIPKQTAHDSSDERWRPRRPRLLTVLLTILALIAMIHLIAVAHQGDLGVAPTTCTGLMRNTDYTQIVHLQPKTQEMGAVQFVNQLVGGQPATLVQVVNSDTQNTLDTYIYGCVQQQYTPHLVSLFSQRGLPQGTASVSASNTLVLGQLDTNLSPQAAALVQSLQQNIYREYRWLNGAFVQVAYPSLYPVTSRSEAEALQQQANNSQSLPWSDPLATAEQMAKDIFKWSGSSPQDSIANNNGTTAQVQLFQQNPSLQITVTLERLVQHNNTGLWFVTGATSSGMTLAQPQSSTSISSPVTVKGTGGLADGQTTATLFDHTYTPLSLLNNPTLSADSTGTFNGMLFYSSNAPHQEGLLLVQSSPPAGSTETGQLVLIKVLIG